MLRVVLDPGVLVSGLIAPQGVCAQLLAAALAGQIGVVACPSLIDELEDVVLRPKFRRYFSTEQARQYVARFSSLAEHYPEPAIQSGVAPDPDDDCLVALVHDAGSDHLISGDAHPTTLTGIGVSVLSPGAFLDILMH